ncbi:hypothetical protein [Enterococcus devriesei]|uniref:hypothetical protein n=1 Tax=Enterococcus devriesei TaxID=319970 RepID=UPI0036D3C6F5
MQQVMVRGKKFRQKILKQPSKYLLILGLLGLTLLRLVLSVKAAYYVNLFAGYDDQLFINQGNELLRGHWLGDYTTRTLSKGISYPLFMALGNKFHLSYGIFLGLFNILASSVSALALRPLIKNRWLIASIYSFFLYSPVTFTGEYSTRIYRNTIVVPAVFLVLGCLVGLYFRRKEKLKIFAPWSIGLSLIFPFYWYIREDSLWLLPLLVVGLLIIASAVLFENTRELKLNKPLLVVLKRIKIRQSQLIKLLLCILPFILLLTTHSVLKSLNEDHYGIAVVNDRTGGAFGQVSKQLIRMDDGTDLNETNSKIWVSRKALDKAEAVSPTLKTISKKIDWIYHGSTWSKGEDIAGDIIFWALREAAAQAGYYRDGKKTEAFWQKVNTELANAYKKKQLTKKKEIYLTATGDGKHLKDFPLVGEFMKSGWDYNVFYKGYRQANDTTVGPEEEVLLAEQLLHHSFSNNWRDSNKSNPKPIELTKAAKISNIVIRIYQKIVPLWLIVFSIGFLLILFGSFFSKSNSSTFRGLLLLITGLSLSYVIFLIGVSWFCSWAPERRDLFMMVYTGGGVPVIQWIEVLALVGIFQLPRIASKVNKKS